MYKGSSGFCRAARVQCRIFWLRCFGEVWRDRILRCLSAARLICTLCTLLLLAAFPSVSCGYSYRVYVPLSSGGHLPAFCFLPDYPVKHRLPAVIVGVGVGSHLIPQYHEHCQHLASCGFAVLLMDPSNYPESLFPSPFTWDKGLGYAQLSFNQVVVAGKLFFDIEWYLDNIRACVDFLCSWPLVDASRIALSGHSQPANAALTYACRDLRIKAVIWNYGGSPWVMPYDPMKLPPVQIFHGDEDEVYDVKYAYQLALNLKSHMRCCDDNIYPGQKHIFNIYYDPAKGESRYSNVVIMDAFGKLVNFLRSTLLMDLR